MSGSRLFLRQISLVVLALFLAGCVSLVPEALQSPPHETPTAPPEKGVSDPSGEPLVDAEGLDFAERRVVAVYERVAPSVVNINTQILRRGFFFQVFPEEGAGSGFVLDREGHILTNFHVVKGAASIEVTLGEDRIFPARLVGADPRTDLAVLRIDAPRELLVPVELGSSANLRVGQRAIAIGNPFGQFSRTLTIGAISALNRTLEGQDGRPISGIIQTDAAINRGNSGGPLLDSSGRVIGITTAIFSPTGGNVGVGFAVPVDTIKRVLPDLLDLGYYRHPFLGVRYAYRITPTLAQALDLPVDSGLLLVQLYPDSPLERAGVRGAQHQVVLRGQRFYVGGDILVAIDGQPVRSLEELQIQIEEYRVGDSVTVALIREDEPFQVVVTLEPEPRP